MQFECVATVATNSIESADQAAKRKKAEELNHSRPLDVHRWSEYPEVNTAVDEIYAEIIAGAHLDKYKSEIKRRHIKVIVLDVYTAYISDPALYVGCHRGRTKYNSKSRYNALHISNLTPKIIDALEAMGYLENHIGNYDRSGKRASHVSRIRATSKLIKTITGHPITPAMLTTAKDRECIVLREFDATKGKKGKQVDIEYEDTPQTCAMRAKLTAYNLLMQKTFVDIPDRPAGGIPGKKRGHTIPVELLRNFTRRIFNNGSWTDGGRFYGPWWQQAPKDWRAKIRINGQSVIEVDYSGLHIVLLYALEGIDYWTAVGKDPYLLPGYTNPAGLDAEQLRELLKIVLLYSVNAKNRKTGLKAIRKKLNFNKKKSYQWWDSSIIDLDEIIDRFVAEHKAIGAYFFSNAGMALQYLDSLFAEEIMDWFTKKNQPCLVIHDSFIVPLALEDELTKKMQKYFEEIVGEQHGLWGTKERVSRYPDRMPWHVVQVQHRSPYGDPEIFNAQFGEEKRLERDYPNYKQSKRDYGFLNNK